MQRQQQQSMQQQQQQYWKPELRPDIQMQLLQQQLVRRFDGLGKQTHMKQTLVESLNGLPTEFVGTITDNENDLIKQFKFSHVKWFSKNNCFALGYNKQMSQQRKQGYFSIFDLNEWKLRYSKFATEESMVGLEKQDHLNRILAFGSNGGIYTIGSGQEAQKQEPIIRTAIDRVTEGTFSPNQSKFAFSSQNKNVYLVDTQKMTEMDALKGHGKDVTTTEWNPIHNLLLSGSEDETIKMWDPLKREEICSLKRHNLGVKKVRWNLDGTYFLTSGKDRFLIIFDIRKVDTEIHKINLQCQIDSILWHPCYKNIFVTGDQFGTISYWNLNAPNEAIIQIKKPETLINDLALDNSGQFLASIRAITNEKDQREIFKKPSIYFQ